MVPNRSSGHDQDLAVMPDLQHVGSRAPEILWTYLLAFRRRRPRPRLSRRHLSAAARHSGRWHRTAPRRPADWAPDEERTWLSFDPPSMARETTRGERGRLQEIELFRRTNQAAAWCQI